MLENVILLFFSLLLLGSVFTGVPILAALLPLSTMRPASSIPH